MRARRAQGAETPGGPPSRIPTREFVSTYVPATPGSAPSGVQSAIADTPCSSAHASPGASTQPSAVPVPASKPLSPWVLHVAPAPSSGVLPLFWHRNAEQQPHAHLLTCCCGAGATQSTHAATNECTGVSGASKGASTDKATDSALSPGDGLPPDPHRRPLKAAVALFEAIEAHKARSSRGSETLPALRGDGWSSSTADAHAAAQAVRSRPASPMVGPLENNVRHGKVEKAKRDYATPLPRCGCSIM